MRIQSACTVLLAVPLLAVAALGQEKVTMEMPLPAPLGGRDPFVVRRVDPNGTILLTLNDSVPPQYRRFMTLTEGYYVLLARDGQSQPPRVLRVQVTDVGAEASTSLTTTPDAAGALKVGEMVQLMRPPGATTASLRSLPGRVPFVGEGTGAGAADDLAEAKRAASLARSTNNLKQLGLALHNFHDTYGAFPPAVIHGPDGKPWHSWRVLLLPFLEQNELFKQYDFNQPWDGPKNRLLLDRMPEVFRDPIHGDAKTQFTHYAALVGPTTLFKPEGGRMQAGQPARLEQGGVRIAEITDGTSNTIVFVPADPGRKIPWTKPEDIVVGPNFPGLGKPGGVPTPYVRGLRGAEVALAPTLFADGSVRTIAATVNPLVFNALLSRNGGEVVSSDAIPGASPARAQMTFLRIEMVNGQASARMTTESIQPPVVPAPPRP